MSGKKKSETKVTPLSRYWGGARRGIHNKPSPFKTRIDIKTLLTRVKNHLENGEDVGLIDPLTWWVHTLNDPEQPLTRRDNAALQIANFTIAKPKPVDSMGNSDNHLVIEIQHQGSPTMTYSTNHAPSLALPQPVIDVEMDDDD